MTPILSLYRAYLRQVRALPHVHLRHFFKIKATDDIRSVLKTTSVELLRKKLNRVSKDLQRLRAANGGQSSAFDRVLDLAYGRRGKLRWELIEPLLSDSNPPLPSPPTPQKERIRSPAYSPELATLLTSSISRMTRPLQTHHLVSPPGVLRHATSDSEDGVLFGPLSKRREYNIRWRFYKNERRKLYPPLQVSSHHPANYTNTRISSNPPANFGFQNTVTLPELFALAGSPPRTCDLASKQGRPERMHNMSDTNRFDGSLPVRWLRRRYQALLGRIPLLVPRPVLQANCKRPYDVRLADQAITSSRPHSSRLCVVGAEDVPWISDVPPMAQPERHNK